MRGLLAAVALVAALGGASAFTWTPCDADKVPFTPDVVQLTPDPPQAGGSVTFVIKGNAVHDVPHGLISINVSFADTQIYEEVDDLCSKTSCPIKTGPIDITYVQDLPPIAPPGEYDVEVVARGVDDEELMCVVVHFEMLPPSFVQALLPGAWLGKGGGGRAAARVGAALPAAARRLLRRLF
ncbi:npc-2 [Scenedesmus sp. PABB004]|nr:npc-2 [Scenedesmus sp. PABB004]